MIKKGLNKKSKFNFYDNQIEYMFVVVVVLGSLFGLASRSMFLAYFTIMIFGLAVGRMFYYKKKILPFPRYAITIGFLFGFLVANYRFNTLWLVFWFLLASYFSYKLHENKIISFLE